ncbi:Holliday junction resolvase RuvX [Enterobacteriaceae endosymbiont of Plateumaris rustica]|uniref:Holliday junction resolvase RuvX n=1 Tax=Enterobacteriaceae endosymbiont of Plateumaris rustica TaxID=2675796 RepID=UPI001449BF56|nr:Holliday junction resolvase RuvX [Enterobacteriaceae endosymbiont of Plateumaris rustica]QJC29133.1 Holliday junction resolvase RuvX [Enterobacteriaceae endosymbiont of Plateumaris rustica]
MFLNKKNITLLAFDYGTKNIGVAVGQTIIGIAHSLKKIKNNKKGKPDWNEFKKIIKYWKPNKIIIGLPLNMNGSEQNITILTKKFAYLIKTKFNVNVELHDERLSTIEAKNILFTNGGWKMLKKNDVNSLSASVILQSWFENNKFYLKIKK